MRLESQAKLTSHQDNNKRKGHYRAMALAARGSAQEEEKESLVLTAAEAQRDDKNLKGHPACYILCEMFDDTLACYDECDRNPRSALLENTRG